MIGLVVVLIGLAAGSGRFETDAVRENIEQGRAKYDELRAMPSECWAKAVSDLEESCGRLDEESMARLAYALLTCHLQQHRRPVSLCSPDTEVDMCTGTLTDTMFGIYSTFVMHTHNMCFYLQSTAWQHQLDRTVDRLQDNSDRVAGNLEIQAKRQENLMIAMDAVSDLNTDILGKTEKLQSFISYVVTMIERIGYIQQSFYDHISTYEKMLFYCGCIAVVIITTAFPGVNRARIFMLSLTAVSYAAEQAVASVYQDSVTQYMVQRQIRKVWLALCFYKWLKCFYTGDTDARNTQSILNETIQTREIVKKLSAKLSRRCIADFSDSDSDDDEDTPVIITPRQFRRDPRPQSPIKSVPHRTRTPAKSPGRLQTPSRSPARLQTPASPARNGTGRYNLRPAPSPRAPLPLAWISGEDSDESDTDYVPHLDVSQI